jgi:hypothetical protein
MKQINKTILLLLVLGSFTVVFSQNTKRIINTVTTSESTDVKKDSLGTHYITTIRKDSVVGDSVFTTKTIRTTTTKMEGIAKVTKVVGSTTMTKSLRSQSVSEK